MISLRRLAVADSSGQDVEMFSIVFDLTFRILVGWIRFLSTPSSQIETENLFLRYQLQVLKRQVSSPVSSPPKFGAL